MKVLLISHTCQSRAEGQRKAEQVARLGGIELMVLAPERFNHYGIWKDAEQPGLPGFEFAARKARWLWLGPAQNYLHWYPSLRKIIREFQPDVIDLWEEPWALVSAQACWLRNRHAPQARIVMESEQNLHKRFPVPFRWIESYVIGNADHAVGRTGEVIAVLRAKGYKGPARVVGNAADTELFRPLDRTACRRALDWEEFTVGYVGRLVERKGLMDIIEALSFLPGDVRLAFVGSGEFRPALERRIAELGKAEQVRFLAARPLEELPQVMNALDALILPSRTVASWKEQFGRVIIEAHACGTPVIGSDSGAIPEVVGQGGLIFPEGDARALAAAILRLRSDPSLGRQLGANGRRQVEASYTWTRVAAQMRDIYLTFNRRGPAVPQAVRKTVLFFSHTAKLGGGEILLLNLVQELDRGAYDLVVALASDGPLREKLEAAGIETHVLPLAAGVVETRKDTLGGSSLLRLGAVWQTLMYILRLARFIRRRRIDLVHTNTLKADAIGGLSARLARVPVIWHVHDRIETDYLPAQAVQVFRWLCGWLPTFVIANSRATLQTLHLKRDEKAIVHEGCLLGSAVLAPALGDAPLVGLVGRISPWKGQHVFLEAAATVREKFPRARFQIIGSAMFGEDAYEAKLHALVKERGLAGCVEFTGFRADVRKLIGDLTILVHASTTGEPFGQVVIEGMAAGKPVVATRGGGIPEIVLDGRTGLLVPMGEVQPMADALVRLLTDPVLAGAMGQAGRQRVSGTFTIQHTARKVEAIYDAILRSPAIGQSAVRNKVAMSAFQSVQRQKTEGQS